MANSVDSSLSALKWIGLCCAILAFIITIIFFIWWGMKERFVFGGQTFNQVLWMTAKPTPENRCYRGDMALDIKEHVLQSGFTREKTTLLLGRPSWEDASHSEYELGYCLWATHGLRLFFDEHDVLVFSRISQH